MPRFDFNGDGRDDIIFRATQSGDIFTWLGQANGSFAFNEFAGVEPAEGTLLAIGDWNGDGRSDTLWRLFDDEVYAAFTDAGGVILPFASLGFVAEMPTTWHVAGTGDFNGDGRDDAVWQNGTGAIVIWRSTADYVFNSNITYQLPSDWAIIGTGDFNGDGRDDAVLRNGTGTIIEWLGGAEGQFVTNQSNATYNLPNDWHLAGVGDFNGDNRDDILLRHSGGNLIQWLGTTTGAFVYNDTANYTLPVSWDVQAVGDFNGDGYDDLFLRNSDGIITNWLGGPNGQFFSNYDVAIYDLDTEWQALSNPLRDNAWDYF